MSNADGRRLIFIVGPTAVGKTSLAIKLAERIKGEIISADSMQAYQGLDIISQKPTRLEQKRVPHHLLSFLNPREEYSAARFSKLTKKIIKDLIKRNKIPVVVGGSGLYIKVLVDGIFPSKGKDERVRKSLQKLADKKGKLFLYSRLKKIDPISAENIHPNDLKRIIRALEIYGIEGKTKTNLKRKTKGVRDEYDIKIFGLIMDRKKLYEKIDRRVDAMFKRGVVREVKKLLSQKLSITSRQALGIKEIEGYLDKIYDIAKAKETLRRNTRRFAKRQLTWFRADKRIMWMDVGERGEKQAVDIIVSRLGG